MLNTHVVDGSDSCRSVLIIFLQLLDNNETYQWRTQEFCWGGGGVNKFS